MHPLTCNPLGARPANLANFAIKPYPTDTRMCAVGRAAVRAASGSAMRSVAPSSPMESRSSRRSWASSHWCRQSTSDYERGWPAREDCERGGVATSGVHLWLAIQSERRWCTRDVPPASALHVLRRHRCAAHELVLTPVQLLVGRRTVAGPFATAALLPPALGAAGPRAQRPSRTTLCQRRGQVGGSGSRRVAAPWWPRVAGRSPPRPPSRGRRPHVALQRWRTTN